MLITSIAEYEVLKCQYFPWTSIPLTKSLSMVWIFMLLYNKSFLHRNHKWQTLSVIDTAIHFCSASYVWRLLHPAVWSNISYHELNNGHVTKSLWLLYYFHVCVASQTSIITRISYVYKLPWTSENWSKILRYTLKYSLRTVHKASAVIYILVDIRCLRPSTTTS